MLDVISHIFYKMYSSNLHLPSNIICAEKPIKKRKTTSHESRSNRPHHEIVNDLPQISCHLLIADDDDDKSNDDDNIVNGILSSLHVPF